MNFSVKCRIDPLGDDVKAYCLSKNVCHEHLFDYIKKKVSKSFTGTGQGTFNNIELLVQVEYRDSLDDRILEFSRVFYEEECFNEMQESRVEELMAYYSGKWIEDSVRGHEKISDIDKGIEIGGKTRLHVAVMEKDIEEVKILVEVNGAKVNVRDNFGDTPYKRALDLGYDEIAEYLKDRMP